MNLRDAKTRAETFYDRSHLGESNLPDRDYNLAGVLGPCANKSRRRINNTTWFLGIVAIAWILAMIF